MSADLVSLLGLCEFCVSFESVGLLL